MSDKIHYVNKWGCGYFGILGFSASLNLSEANRRLLRTLKEFSSTYNALLTQIEGDEVEAANYFCKLFEYDYWSNREALSSLGFANPVPETPLKIFGHVIGAQRVWLARIDGDVSAAPVPWPRLTLEDCKGAVDELHGRWTRLLGNVAPAQLTENVTYRNSKGVEFKTPLEDVLQHVIIHSAYHRGQVAVVQRQAGARPALTDYVVYIRQNAPAR